ncbi:hypothetical protein MIND_00730800 [Mycena indigotica]|uniref:CCHC-type domain-containing protein n=1 Tax=Mycena indigotica TaxID=2126181 RepID=A0A8H6W4N5_9AGAR|nr:uncharacterized protein MIND_00730800 [Mycena indigotica]KAF7301653.1 hypothetical protein MIND_00730800 [Mycena indigotica]
MGESQIDIIDLTREDSPIPEEAPSQKRKREGRNGEGKHGHRREEREGRRQKRGHSRERNIMNTKQHADFFCVDLAPADITIDIAQPNVANGKHLILPAHVTVFGDTTEITLPAIESDSEQEDYIEYLDYNDNRKHFVRYYEEDEPEDNKRTKTICKKCGEEGHTKDKCTVLICQTCGARDEHSTRSCNVSKHCFSCGMRGHVRQDCPNSNAQSRYERLHDCERCGAPSHLTRECPTLWRLYNYLTEAEHTQVLQTRKEKKGLSLGQGGEGYIAEDAWCYVCAKRGHFGDDCQRREERPLEYSAFSHKNLSDGPFKVSDPEPGSPMRDDFLDAPLPGGVDNVGKQGRNKEKERLAQRAKQDDEVDPDDWFQNGRGVSIRGAANRERMAPTAPRRMSLPKSLGERLGNAPIAQHQPQRHDNHNHSKSRDRQGSSRGKERDYNRQRERDRGSRDRGPRYRGGYSRD